MKKTVDHRINKSLPEMILGYTSRHIFNADKTARFYSLMPDKDWTLIGVTCAGHKSKEQVTILLCCNANVTEKTEAAAKWKVCKTQLFKKC